MASTSCGSSYESDGFAFSRSVICCFLCCRCCRRISRSSAPDRTLSPPLDPAPSKPSSPKSPLPCCGLPFMLEPRAPLSPARRLPPPGELESIMPASSSSLSRSAAKISSCNLARLACNSCDIDGQRKVDTRCGEPKAKTSIRSKSRRPRKKSRNFCSRRSWYSQDHASSYFTCSTLFSISLFKWATYSGSMVNSSAESCP
mmetsp:Transcript_156698/g.272671  ORF Transcript_156698/g.272671 Transcript_156698/m.272671 type:complete len:201 (+) Transcript_156698:2343-2945(+)